MGFSWNGVHTSELSVWAELQALPVSPEPKSKIQEIPGRSGFYNFSAFNSSNKVLVTDRLWEYRCGFEHRTRADLNRRAEIIRRLFALPSGILIADEWPEANIRWNGYITNRMDMTKRGLTLSEWTVIFRTQPYWEGYEEP